MSVFDIIYNDLPVDLMPVESRKPKHKAWLRALINGTVTPLYNLFFANRSANVYFLKYNSQVCYMEAVLNDTFDNTLRRIYITDAPVLDPVYLYLIAEGLHVPLYTIPETAAIPLYTAAEVGASVAGFVVWVPSTLVYDLIRLRALVNTYRLPSMANWIIRTF